MTHFSLAKDQLVYIGLRDIDPYEAFILNKFGIRYYAMDVSGIDTHGYIYVHTHTHSRTILMAFSFVKILKFRFGSLLRIK